VSIDPRLRFVRGFFWRLLFCELINGVRRATPHFTPEIESPRATAARIWPDDAR